MGDYYSCANSRPQLGIGRASIYACPYAPYRTGKLDSLERCLKCPSYSDARTAIDVSYKTYQARIYMNRLSDMPVRKATKLFRMIWKAKHENGEAISELDKYLTSMFITHNVETKGRVDKKWIRLYQLWREEAMNLYGDRGPPHKKYNTQL